MKLYWTQIFLNVDREEKKIMIEIIKKIDLKIYTSSIYETRPKQINPVNFF